MSRLSIPASIEAAPEASRPLLEHVKTQLGSTPNLFRLAAQSPSALEGYLGLYAAVGKDSLGLATRERIALAVAQYNGCDYCLSAHSYLGANLAKLSPEEIAENRKGRSTDARADAAVAFALKVVDTRGHVSGADLTAVRDAGYAEAQIIEIVLNISLSVWTNYLNDVAQTDIDFPLAEGVTA